MVPAELSALWSSAYSMKIEALSAGLTCVPTVKVPMKTLEFSDFSVKVSVYPGVPAAVVTLTVFVCMVS
ncbi:hypothetical protein D3C73_695460 [compost metagenome]